MVAIREIIVNQAKSNGTTFLISSHLAHELEVICNKVAIMKEGRLLKTATMKKVLEESGTLEKYFLKTIESKKED